MPATVTVMCAGAPMPLTVLRWPGAGGSRPVESLTDESGCARVPVGAGAGGVRVLTRTSVASVVGGRPLRVGEHHIPAVPDDGTLDLPAEPAFLLARDCAAAYLRVFRAFPPFDRPDRRFDPLGTAVDRTAPTPLQRGVPTPAGSGIPTPAGSGVAIPPPRGIDVVFPDRSPARLSFVEPAAPPAGLPRLRLRPHDAPVPGRVGSPIIAHELAHALHFALMPLRTRVWVESRYLAWIGGRVALRRDPTHDTLRRTGPLVAWLESLGLFAERFWAFREWVAPGLRGPALERAFVRDESSDSPSLAGRLPGYQPVGQFVAGTDSWHDVPADIEGAVYASVFLALARRASLRTAVALYFASGRRGTLSLPRFAADLARGGHG